MNYEVEQQIGEMKCTVRGDDIDALTTLLVRLGWAEEDVKSPHDKGQAAIATLESLGYEHRGGVLWAPPVREKDADGFTPWAGGAQPPETKGKRVRYEMRDTNVLDDSADCLVWKYRGSGADIVAYKVLA